MSLNDTPAKHEWHTLVLVGAIAAASLSVFAQSPPPAPGAQTPPAGRGAQGGGAGRSNDPFEGADLSPKNPIVAVSAAEELKRFVMMPGYKLELVLAEPDIKEPMQFAFDGNGRMYV